MVLFSLLVCLCILPGLAHAEILYVEGFDMANEETGTARDVFGWSETLLGSGIDADIRHVQDTAWCQNDTNGGDSSSNGCLLAIPFASGKGSYYKPCEDYSSGCDLASFPLSTYTMSVHFALGIDNPPGTSTYREVFRFHEDDSDPIGCNLELGPSRELRLYYGDQLLYSGGTFYLDENSCASPYQYVPCTVNGDCPNNDCSTNKFLASITMRQVSSSPTVTCILDVNGRTFYDSGNIIPSSGTPGVMDTFWIGAPDSSDSDSAAIYYIDSLVVSDDLNLGWGYVATLTPCDKTEPNDNWTSTGGSSCTNQKKWECINDYWDDDDSYLYEPNRVRKSPTGGNVSELQIAMGKRKATTTNDYTCDSYEASLLMCQSGADQGKVCTAPSDCADSAPCEDTLISGMAVEAFSSVVIGDTSTVAGSPSWIFASGFEWNLGGAIAGTYVSDCTNLTEDNTSRELGRKVEDSPTSGSRWSSADMSNLDLVLRTCDGASNYAHRVRAACIYAFISRSGVGVPRTVRDGNKGTDDGLLVVGFMGDSLLHGTQQATCVGGTSEGQNCNQPDYCSWDADDQRDKPTGGCFGLDVMCQTCSGRTSEYNSNAGYNCDGTARYCSGHCSTTTTTSCLDDSDCPGGETCILNTCDYTTGYCIGGANDGLSCSDPTDCPSGACRGLCTDNDLAWCETDTDCANLGTCQYDATCDDSCPGGGECPEHYTPAAHVIKNLNVDYAINWAQGLLFSRDNYNNYFSNALNGVCSSSARCTALLGAGRCTCDTTTECGDSGTCAADSTYCPYGTKSKCCSGTSDVYSACSSPNDCASGYECVFPPPDMIAVMIGTNDMLTGNTYTHPNCEGMYSYTTTGTTKPCACSTDTLCSTDADCAAGGVCIGFNPANSANRCTTRWVNHCTVSRAKCWTDDDCAGWGGSCSTSDYSAPYKTGTCACTSDTDCIGAYGASYSCINGLCRYECSTDADCDNVSGACEATTPKTCKGFCTCPSSSISCTDDSDCESVETGNFFWSKLGHSTVTIHGKCNIGTGKCECTGIDNCGERGPLECTDTGTLCTDTSDCNTGAACVGPCYYSYAQDTMGTILTTNGKLQNLYYFDQMQADIDALGDVDNKPVLAIVPPPLPASNTQAVRDAGMNPRTMCGQAHGNHGYLLMTRQSLMSDTTNYSYVVDLPNVFEAYPSSQVLSIDGVHFNNFGAQVVGERMAEWANGHNVCAINTGNGARALKPQKYCRNLDATWETTECDDDLDCNSDERCEIKVCVCDCVSGYCLYSQDVCTTDADCCYSGATCTANVCGPDNTICPGTAVCNAM